MTEKVLSQEDLDRERRTKKFQENFHKQNPYMGHLLKSHLYLESVLEEIVFYGYRDVSVAIEAKLTFFNKLKLAQARAGTKDSRIWESINRLNSARNALAHGKEIEFLEARIDKFNHFVISEFKLIDKPAADRANRLAFCLHYVSGYLDGIAFRFTKDKI